MRSGEFPQKTLPSGRTSGGSKKNPQTIKIYRLLYSAFGPQGWWPVTPARGVVPVYKKGIYKKCSLREMTEICAGAILTQNASWNNASKAVSGLKRVGLLDFKKISAVSLPKLRKAVRPSGYYRQKALKLKEFSSWFLSEGARFNGALTPVKKILLRGELLSVKGIGPETADSILLYAWGAESFVIDSYTKRIWTRIFGLRSEPEYGELKEEFENSLPVSVKIYNEFHALLVTLAKNFCLKNKPLCQACPLKKHCAQALKENR